MKINLIILYVMCMFVSPIFCSERAHHKIDGVEQENVFNSSFYAFHEHDLYPEIAQAPGFVQPTKSSLYQKFNSLPVGVQHHITGYVKKVIEQVDPVTERLIVVDDLVWKQKRKQQVTKALQSWQPEDLACIKDCFRSEYWDRYVKRARNEHAMTHNNTRMVPSEFAKIICRRFDHDYFSISNVLYNPCANKYPEHDVEIAQLMIACGALVNYKRNALYNSLYYAIEKDNVVMVDALIQYGLTQAGKKPFCCIALMHEAAEKNACNVIRYLHKKGYDLNVQEVNGITPLHRAYFYEKKDAVTLLLELGADPKIKNARGRTYDNDGNTFLKNCAEIDARKRW